MGELGQPRTKRPSPTNSNQNSFSYLPEGLNASLNIDTEQPDISDLSVLSDLTPDGLTPRRASLAPRTPPHDSASLPNRGAQVAAELNSIAGSHHTLPDRLGTLVQSLSSQLASSTSWHGFVKQRQGSPFLSSKLETLDHPAASHLTELRDYGVPALMSDEPWSQQRLQECLDRGCHTSANDHQQFIRDEMSDNIEHGFWVVLPFEQVKHLPNLRLSPLGVKEERERRPRLVVDHTWFGVNDATIQYTPKEAMQFGGTLPRILHKVRHADPAYGPVYLSKIDIADGFYRMHMAPDDAPTLATILPRYEGEEQLVAIPISSTMGWVNSPPTFCAASETAADVANNRMYRRHAPPHRLEAVAEATDEDWDNQFGSLEDLLQTRESAATSTASASTSDSHLPSRRSGIPSNQPLKKPLADVDVFVDDFIGLVQGNRHQRKKVRRILLHAIDDIFEPPGPNEPHRKEPSSLKKLLKGDGAWGTRKIILGWVIDTLRQTLEVPDHRRERLDSIFEDLRGKRRVGLKKWQQITGELRFMSLAIPGSSGLFSALQLGIKHADKHRVKVTQHIRRHLDDFERLAKSLTERPTRLAEIIPESPRILGACDAAKAGMGGVIFTQDGAPILWRAPFPHDIQSALVSDANPTGDITNSDLEQAGILAQADVACHAYDSREQTMGTLSDNTPAVSRFRKGSVTTDTAAAYLCRLASLHQRYYRYYHEVSYMDGLSNAMADDASRRWDLSDASLLDLFASKYPQSKPWIMLTLRPEMLSSLISSLRKTWVPVASSKKPTTTRAATGTSGRASAPVWESAPISPQSLNISKYTTSWFTPSATDATSSTATGSPARSPSDISAFRLPYKQSGRSSKPWAYKTPVSLRQATLSPSSSGCTSTLTERTQLPLESGPSASASSAPCTPTAWNTPRQPTLPRWISASSPSSSSVDRGNTPNPPPQKKETVARSPFRTWLSPLTENKTYQPPRVL